MRIAKSMGLGITSFADFFNINKPDILFLTGAVRNAAAGLAAVPLSSIAHLTEEKQLKGH